jgi:hypothetical protein
MAAPRSFVPQRPSRSSTRRYTLKEAVSTLPLVKRIVADIVKTHANAMQLRQRVESLNPGREQTIAQDTLHRTLEQLQEFLDELNALGIELKDPQMGLIDFVARQDNRDVYLCWKLGEETITHWHELDAGFAGRKPIASFKDK